MDDSAPNTSRAKDPQVVPEPVQPVVSPTVAVAQSVPVAQVQPVSIPSKEHQPVITATEMTEIMQPAEQEPVISPEVKAAGVETVLEHPSLTIEDHRTGMRASGASLLHPTQPSGVVKLPMTPEEAVDAVKNEPVASSKKWLGMLIVKHLVTLHKKITGGHHDS